MTNEDSRRVEKSVLLKSERLRAAMMSEYIPPQSFENDHKHLQVKEKTIKTNSYIEDHEIHSLIESKVKEVCLHES